MKYDSEMKWNCKKNEHRMRWNEMMNLQTLNCKWM